MNPFGIRTSMSDYREQDALVNVPLYAISRLFPWRIKSFWNNLSLLIFIQIPVYQNLTEAGA